MDDIIKRAREWLATQNKPSEAMYIIRDMLAMVEWKPIAEADLEDDSEVLLYGAHEGFGKVEIGAYNDRLGVWSYDWNNGEPPTHYSRILELMPQPKDKEDD